MKLKTNNSRVVCASIPGNRATTTHTERGGYSAYKLNLGGVDLAAVGSFSWYPLVSFSDQ